MYIVPYTIMDSYRTASNIKQEEIEMTVKKGKSYTVKEWFANKVAEEVKQNITDCDVFAVIKETEKAVYAMLYIGFERKKQCGFRNLYW